MSVGRESLAGPSGSAFFYLGRWVYGVGGVVFLGCEQVAQQILRRTGRCSVHLWIR
jgi:hypothetical protein